MDRTTFDALESGQAFRFPGGRTVFIRLDEWTMKSTATGRVIPIGGESGHPPRDEVIRERWMDFDAQQEREATGMARSQCHDLLGD
jgi:hypothetical protein